MAGWKDGQAQRMDDYIKRINGWMDGWTLDKPSGWMIIWKGSMDGWMDGQWTGQADGLYREAQRMARWIDGQA